MSKCPKCGWTLTWLDDEWWCGDCDWTGSEAVRAASQTSTNVDDLPDASLVESSAHSDGWQRPPHNGSSDSDGAAQS